MAEYNNANANANSAKGQANGLMGANGGKGNSNGAKGEGGGMGFASSTMASVRSGLNAVGAAAGLNSSADGTPPTTSMTLVLFVVLACFVLVIVIVYIVYRMRRGDLQSITLVPHPIKLYNMPSPVTVQAATIPPTLNGQEFSFSFWLYLVEFQPTSEHKLVFMRGGSGADVLGATPVVFLDARTNRLHIAVKSNQAPGVSDLGALLQSDTSRYMTAAIDYVPLQRWVNVVMVVQDNLLTVYLDGDMYTVENVFDLAPSTADVRPIFAGTSGNATIGSVSGTAPTKGFLGKLQFFNYALMVQDVKALYAQGPVPASMLSLLGLSAYGVRSPLYRVE
jgi:hypothetical protein